MRILYSPDGESWYSYDMSDTETVKELADAIGHSCIIRGIETEAQQQIAAYCNMQRYIVSEQHRERCSAKTEYERAWLDGRDDTLSDVYRLVMGYAEND